MHLDVGAQNTEVVVTAEQVGKFMRAT